ncbi:hypothetical protein PLICRDRAFT_43665 [Plicaturopsis crispa FD-325 SS-3]|nr:hypothetical protein PLICRDRAFT_43665 [Plicaturopsis crispa FD-325 SS-3]
MIRSNKPVPGAREYYPLNEPAIGTAYTDTKVYPQNDKVPLLFQPLTIKSVTFKNRIFVSPMCQYSSDNGHATDWHFVHIGGLVTRGVGAVCMEATSVVPEGRISPEDAGLWTDSQMEPLKRIVDFAHAQGTKIGIQLSHAGRKASTLAPWVHSDVAKSWVSDTYVARKEAGGWPDDVYAPSEVPYAHDYPVPKAMTEADLQKVEDAFVAAVKRVDKIGFDFIELHAAHGYLLHEFLSPLSNVRTDAYGGSLENRMRFPLRIASKIRSAWSKPFFVRLSTTDWAAGPEKGEDGAWKYWSVEQSKILAGELVKLDLDLLDCSSGGNWAQQKIPIGPGYQIPLAEEIKKAHPTLLTGVVGLITSPQQAESCLQSGKADVVFLARELIRRPHWPIFAAQELGVAVKPANQYERGWVDVLTPRKD